MANTVNQNIPQDIAGIFITIAQQESSLRLVSQCAVLAISISQAAPLTNEIAQGM